LIAGSTFGRSLVEPIIIAAFISPPTNESYIKYLRDLFYHIIGEYDMFFEII